MQKNKTQKNPKQNNNNNPPPPKNKKIEKERGKDRQSERNPENKLSLKGR